jgi:hypothetical protein
LCNKICGSLDFVYKEARLSGRLGDGTRRLDFLGGWRMGKLLDPGELPEAKQGWGCSSRGLHMCADMEERDLEPEEERG